MRINIACPYEQRHEAKQLGARWDPAGKTWYVVDPEDLRPFAKWLQTGWYGQDKPAKKETQTKAPRKHKPGNQGFVTVGKQAPAVFEELDHPPWEEGEDFERRANQAMLEMLSLQCVDATAQK